MDVTIRAADDRDAGTLAKLYDAFLNETLAAVTHVRRNPELNVDLAVARMMRKEGAVFLIAEAGGSAEGFACVELRRATGRPEGLWERAMDSLTRRLAFPPVLFPARAWLSHLYVAPEHRRKGIASALVRAAADWAKSQGAASLDLNVGDSNAAARRLYERAGMTATFVEYRMPL